MRDRVLFSGFLLSRRSSYPRHRTPFVYVGAWVLACVAGGCGSTVATSTGPSPTKCAVTLRPPEAPVNSGGATTTVAVGTQPECVWNASSSAGWITSVTPASGQGSAQIQMQVAANPDPSTRQANIVVNDVSALITQDAAPCRFDLSSTRQTMPNSGGNGRIAVGTATGCAWSAQSNESWIAITSGANGTGDGSVSFTVAANSGGARSATMVIAGQNVTISQDAAPPPPPPNCNYTVSPRSVAAPVSGMDAASVSVTAPSGCQWSASSSASWISITGRSSSSGNGAVTFSVASNGGSARTGTLTVAGQTVTVNQAGTPCAYTVAPTSVPISVAGGSGTPVSVTTSSTCTWTAISNASWVTIVTGASGSGNGSVTYSIQPNTGAARMGTVTVASQTVTISQSGCVYSISPTNDQLDKAARTGTPISVTTQPSCMWTAVSNASWVTVTSGSSGTGNGTVAYTVAANTTGADRTGTLTIAGLTFTVTQKK